MTATIDIIGSAPARHVEPANCDLPLICPHGHVDLAIRDLVCTLANSAYRLNT